MDLNRKWAFLIIIFVVILSISQVSASEMENISDTSQMPLTSSQTDDNSLSTSDVEVIGDNKLPETPVKPDSPDLLVNETIYIDSTNIDEYFIDGELQQRCSNRTLVFVGDFENVGKLLIGVDNVTIKAAGSHLKNTVFDIAGNNCILSGLTIDLDSEYENNDYAGIFIAADNVTLDNVNINYVTPSNIQAYGIFASGSSQNPLKNVKIINSKVTFEGHNDRVSTYNCAVKFMNCLDAIFENNTVSASLPLKDVNFGSEGATLDSDLVLAVGIEACDNFTFRNNEIFCDVNKRPGSKYPTLDAVMVSKSNNSLIYNNSIYMTDFITYPGTDNYLYGLDIYNLNNLTVARNNIRIVTTGGKLAAGTAYPIQVTGPISGVNITENDLYSFSNGPNIGIYSQNYYGSTALSITKNRINVTGLAGVHEWALVAGIETQDSNSIIRDNIIEVHSVGEVGIEDNIYGVSYRQHTSGNHTYDIQNNTVFSDGFYSVSLLSSLNSIISDNLLVSFNDKINTDGSGFNHGDILSHEGTEFYNNKIMTIYDYYARLNNNLDGESELNYETPINNEGISNDVDGKDILGRNDDDSFSYNPLIPGSSKNSGSNSGLIDNSGENNNPNDDDNGGTSANEDSNNGGKTDNSGVGPSNGGGSSSNVLNLQELLDRYDDSSSSSNSSANYESSSSDVVSNNTDSTPSLEGNTELGQSKASSSASPAGEGSSSVTKAYELQEMNDNNEFIPSIFYVIAAVILLAVGYKRRNSNLK